MLLRHIENYIRIFTHLPGRETCNKFSMGNESARDSSMFLGKPYLEFQIEVGQIYVLCR